MRVFLDTCVFIYVNERPETTGQPYVDALIEALPTITPSATDLVLLECLVRPMRMHDQAIADEYLRTWENVDVLPLGRNEFVKAAELRATHGFKTADALHLAAAINHECAEFWTNDARLARADSEIVIRQIG